MGSYLKFSQLFWIFREYINIQYANETVDRPLGYKKAVVKYTPDIDDDDVCVSVTGLSSRTGVEIMVGYDRYSEQDHNYMMVQQSAQCWARTHTLRITPVAAPIQYQHLTVASETLEGMFFQDYSVNMTHRNTMISKIQNCIKDSGWAYELSYLKLPFLSPPT